MKLTPLDIHHKEFHRSIRGYNEEEVDVFLDEIADEFERLFKENIALGEQIEQLKEKMQQYQTIESTLQSTLFTAQKTAEELRSNAEKEAELMRRDAELKAKDMIQQALAEKQRIQQILLRIKQSEEEFRMRFKRMLDDYTNGISEIPVPEDVVLLTSAPGEEQAAAGTALVMDQVQPEPSAPEKAEPERAHGRTARSSRDDKAAEEARAAREERAAAREGAAAEKDRAAEKAAAEKQAADDAAATGALKAARGNGDADDESALEEPLLSSDVATVASSNGSVRGLQLGEVGPERELGDDIDLPAFLRDPVDRTDEERDRLRKHGAAADLLAGREEDSDIEEIS
jgi:cell division initiation protein